MVVPRRARWRKCYNVVWKKNTGFLVGFLGFRIFLDRIFGDFWRIFGAIFGGFWGTFLLVFNTVLEVLGEVFKGISDGFV